MHAKTWFPSNEMHESPNLTNEPLHSGPTLGKMPDGPKNFEPLEEV